MNIREALDWGTRVLRAVPIENARLDSTLLLASALRMSKEKLYVEAGRVVPSDRLCVFKEMIRRRARGEPVQYITGMREFMSLDFCVRPGVLVPRPETEILVEVVLDLMEKQAGSGHWIADIGTGSGAIAVSLAVMLRKRLGTGLCVVATDVSEEALEVARHNARLHGVEAFIAFARGDLLEPLVEMGLCGKLTAVVSNPPYIPSDEIPGLPVEVRSFEPLLALDGGPDGMRFHRQLVGEAPRFLRPGGFLALEVGAGQAQAVLSLMKNAGFAACGTKKDLAGIDRVVWGYARLD